MLSTLRGDLTPIEGADADEQGVSQAEVVFEKLPSRKSNSKAAEAVETKRMAKNDEPALDPPSA